MTRKNKAKCRAYAVWYVRQLLSWRTDFFNRLSKEGTKPSRKHSAEFQALRHASWYYVDRLAKYNLVKEG
jgi:hypothetical protein